MDSGETKDSMPGYEQKGAVVKQRRRKPKLPTKTQNVDKKHQSDFIALGNDKFITVRKHGADLYLNMRQYKRDAHGRLLATKRGIMLTAAEWAQLRSSVRHVESKLKERRAKMNNSD